MEWSYSSLEWRHNGLDSVSNHQPRDSLFNRLFRRRSKKTSKLRVTMRGIHRGPVNSPHRWPSNAENVSIWRRHHVLDRSTAKLPRYLSNINVIFFPKYIPPGRNVRHSEGYIFKCIFLNENVLISIKISLKFFPKAPINNNPALVQIMTWRRTSHYLNQWR